MESPELSLTMMFAAGAVLLIAGLLIGLLLGRRTSTSSQKHRETERRLDQVLQEKKAYEDEVIEHFSETAKLINGLTDSYREVHNHLAQGATSLCKGQGPVSLDRLGGDTHRDQTEIPAKLTDVQPPLDYAPKSSPEEKGMLNEEFGLDRKAVPPVKAPDQA